jgi:hypothetical protein
LAELPVIIERTQNRKIPVTTEVQRPQPEYLEILEVLNFEIFRTGKKA